MKFVTFSRNGSAEAGVLKGDDVVSLKGAGFNDVLSVIAGGAVARQRIDKWIGEATGAVPLSSVKLMAPMPRPPKVICVGLNYRDHAIESKMEVPKVPTIFSKFSNCVIGPGDNIVLPKLSTKPDYEAEFAVVIGKGGRHIPADKWKEHVFGYMNLNDVSARDFQLATTQWLMGKTCDTFAPMGPYLVSADEIADPHALDIQMTINGEVLQSSNTKHLIFPIPTLIEFLSGSFTLEPGDVISTGTPAGVGASRTPPRWLRPGDECVVKVQGLGELRNPVVAES